MSKNKDKFDNHSEDSLVAQNKAEQVTRDKNDADFVPQGKEDEYYAKQAPLPPESTITQKEEVKGVPAGGISGPVTSVVHPDQANPDKGDGSTPYIGGTSYPDNTGTAADGFQPRQGGEIPAKPSVHKSDAEKTAEEDKQASPSGVQTVGDKK